MRIALAYLIPAAVVVVYMLVITYGCGPIHAR